MGPRTDGPPPIKKLLLPAVFVGGLFYVTLTRTPEVPQQMVVQGEALGTTWALKVVETPTDERSAELRRIVDAALADVDAAMSTYRPDSELMRFNDAEGADPVALSDGLAIVMAEALDIGASSDGAFDVTVGPLVNAWGFGVDKHTDAPSDEVMLELRDRVGFEKVEMTEAGLTKAHPELFIDLSAIAKGYAVDRVVHRLEKAGIENLLMEVGGEIVARGVNPNGDAWRLGIETPIEVGRTVFHAVPLKNQAMATSGDYRQFYEVDGKRVSHLIDPRIGAPIEHRLASVTVVAPRCSTADGWATALSVMGERDGLARAGEKGIAAYFIIRDPDGSFRTESTPKFDALTAK